MKQLLLTLIVGLFTTCSLAQDESLADLHATYGKRKVEIEAAHSNTLAQAISQYATAIQSAEKAYGSRGDLDGVLGAKREAERFSTARAIPNEDEQALPSLVAQARAACRAAQASATRTRDTQLGDLNDAYLKRLKLLEMQYVKGQKLDEALRVRDESRRIEFVLADLQSRVPSNKEEAEPPSPTPIKKHDQIANLTIAKGVDAVRPLRDGETAYSNRKYTWVGIPKDFPVSRFGLTPGGGTETIKGRITSPGWVHIAISDEASQEMLRPLTNAGWEKTESTFGYTARGRTTMFVFKKHMTAGSFAIDRFHWSGPIILLP